MFRNELDADEVEPCLVKPCRVDILNADEVNTCLVRPCIVDIKKLKIKNLDQRRPEKFGSDCIRILNTELVETILA